jgi:hypothetical protein
MQSVLHNRRRQSCEAIRTELIALSSKPRYCEAAFARRSPRASRPPVVALARRRRSSPSCVHSRRRVMRHCLKEPPAAGTAPVERPLWAVSPDQVSMPPSTRAADASCGGQAAQKHPSPLQITAALRAAELLQIAPSRSRLDRNRKSQNIELVWCPLNCDLPSD